MKTFSPAPTRHRLLPRRGSSLISRALVVWGAVAASLSLGGCSSEPGTTSTGGSGSHTTTGGTGGGGAGGATGGAGGGAACKAGETRPCYTGPASTEGVGMCKPGAQACNTLGVFAGPCVGEVKPAPETCATPGDDDCNGQTNEGGAGCICTPGDMESCYTGPTGTEGVGICAAGVRTCDPMGDAWGPCEGEITPQPETCLDLLDDDCNGEVNEDGAGCICTPGETIACYTGPAGTLGVGACKAGKKTCNAQGTAFSACTGEVTPVPETCLTPVDDDCNGEVNEGGAGCACVPGSTASCYTGPAGTLGVGACKAGTKTCAADGSGYGPCAGEVTPQPETCNTPVDDDCNGQTNESGLGCVCPPNDIVPCYSGPAGTAGVGICKAGTQTCNALGTALGPCTGEVTPQPETCFNSVDDDCNGDVNEGCACVPGDVVPCYTGPAGTLNVGACAAGTRTCNAQQAYGPCLGEVTPQPETCLDLIDNDCNGQTNEGGAGCVCAPNSTASCYTGPTGTLGVGACKAGLHTCNAQGTAFGPCVGEVTPQPETCNTPVDDDCNGQTNEGGAGCVCVPGAVLSCYSGPAGTAGVGACKAGLQTCNAQGTAFGACVGEVTPQPETCNTPVDDDCNGQTNEGGAGCICVPNSTAACYTGPAGTLGVGICTGGVTTCNGLGTAYGPCTGEVKPQPENCATAADENCDGATPPCPGALAWAKSWGSVVDDEGIAVATDASDNVLLAGYMNGTIDFGCGPISAGATDGALLVKLTPAGACLWSKRFGLLANVSGVAANAQGDVYFTGTYTSAIDFGGGPVAAAGSADVYVAKFDAAGNYLWAKGFGDAQAQTAVTLAVDAAGDVFVYGYFQGSINFGGGTLTTAGGNDVYLAKLSSTGAHLWSKRFGDASNQLAKGIATDAQGNVLITGNLTGSIDFGGGALTSAGLNDIYLAKLSPTGAHLWSKRYGDSADQNAAAVAVDPQGNVLITGYFNGTIDLGTGPLTSLGAADIFLAKLAPTTGAAVWAQARGGPNNQSSLSLAVDPTGAMSITGVLTGTADFGGGPLTNAGGGDLYVAKYDTAGNHVWSGRFGDTAAQGGKWVAMDSTGATLVTGIIFGPTDFGAGPVPLAGGEDIFLAKFGP
jgi:hypothetical protein